jgi:hypothetical protein
MLLAVDPLEVGRQSDVLIASPGRGSAPPCDLRIRPRIYLDVPLHHVCPTRSCWETVNVCAVT